MKLIKRIAMFVVFPLVMLMIGFGTGVWVMDYFYPGKMQMYAAQETKVQYEASDASESEVSSIQEAEAGRMSGVDLDEDPVDKTQSAKSQSGMSQMNYLPVSNMPETLSVDTDYVVRENDLVDDTMVETVLRLPDKYFGMDREQFIEAMELYEAFPPLAEMERGFVGLEVLSFSGERVVVQMNYRYVEPSNSFYLAVQDNEVVVYLEDGETVYINTGIYLNDLPESVQLDLIQMIWIEDEEELFDFLESYSS